MSDPIDTLNASDDVSRRRAKEAPDGRCAVTPEDLARVTEWERLADTTPTIANAVPLAEAFVEAVPEMARMLREALDGIATVGEQREKWREVAAAWEERAHAAMRLAEEAARKSDPIDTLNASDDVKARLRSAGEGDVKPTGTALGQRIIGAQLDGEDMLIEAFHEVREIDADGVARITTTMRLRGKAPGVTIHVTITPPAAPAA